MLRDDADIQPLSGARRVVTVLGKASRRAFAIHGLLEIDVTRARRLLAEHRVRTGEWFSFTAFVVAAAAQATAADPPRQGYSDWRRRQVAFHDVDVATLVESAAPGGSIPIVHIVRAADKKGLRVIHDEIRAAQRSHAPERARRIGRAAAATPSWLLRLLVALVDRSPSRAKQLKGTVSVTSIGMFGKRGGWGIPQLTHPLAVTVGGIARKPWVVEGRIEVREVLSLTISFDHAVTDGAPAARFAQRLARLLEEAHGLDEALVAGAGSTPAPEG